MAEINPESNTLRSSATKVLRKRYKWLVGIVGVSGIGDLLREYVRGHAIDWTISKLGWFGDFLLANPVALTSLGVVVALIVLTVMVVSESSKEIPSFIYEHRDKTFMRPAASKRWIVGFAFVMMIFIVVILFGTYKYWLHTSRRMEAHSSANSETKAPDIHVQPTVEIKGQRAPTETGHSKQQEPPKKNDHPIASGESHVAASQQVPQQTEQTEQKPVQPQQTQIERIVQADRNLPKGDRDRLAEALFEFSQVLDQANIAFGKANNIKVDEHGPLVKDLLTRRGKVSGIESAATEFEAHFRDSRQKWKYYRDQITAIFGDNPDNDAVILRGAVIEYARQLDSVLSLKDTTDEATLKAIFQPEEIRYDDAIRRFALWKSDCERRLEQARSSLQ